MRFFKSIAVVMTPGLLALAMASAAAPSVEIELKVVDANLRPLQGATVNLYRVEVNSEDPIRVAHSASDENGEASFKNLPPARYRVRADLTGFLDTVVGPLPLAEEDLRSHELPKLVVVLNAVTVY